MAINKDTIRESTFLTIKSLVETVTGLTTKVSFPNDETKLFKKDFPLIVLDPAEVTLDTKTFNNGTFINNVTLIIYIYAVLPRTLDTISDSLSKALQQSSKSEGMKNVEVNDSDVGVINSIFDIHFRAISINFKK